MEKENDNNIRKILTYISKMNQNEKEMNELLNKNMSNLNIQFEKEKCNIKLEEYNFGKKNIFPKLSNILNPNDVELIISWMPNKPIHFNLIFDTKRDGDYSSTFHDKCDGKSPTLVVIKSNSGYIFGGYVTTAFNCNNSNIEAPNSFIFSLNEKQKYYASSQTNSIIKWR